MYANQATQAGGRGLGDTGAAEGRQPEIPEQMDYLRQRVADLDSALNVLLNRIAPVRRIPAPVGNKEANGPVAVPRPLQSPMAQHMESVCSDLSNLNRRVSEALYDLELP